MNNDRKEMDINSRLMEEITKIRKAVEQMNMPLANILMQSFLKGLLTALGATLGLAIVLSLITYIVSGLRLIPFLRNIVDQLPIQKP